MIRSPRATALGTALLALMLTGCGDEEGPTVSAPAATTTPSVAPADAPSASVDVCGLITDAEVLQATKAKALAGPASPAKVGAFQQCAWAPLVNGRDVVQITVAHLPKEAGNITAGMADLPSEKGVGEHVRQRIDGRDLYLEVLDGEHYLSVSLDDNAKLVKDLPALARTLLKAAFARLP